MKSGSKSKVDGTGMGEPEKDLMSWRSCAGKEKICHIDKPKALELVGTMLEDGA